MNRMNKALVSLLGLLLLVPLWASAQRKNVTVTNSDGNRHITATFEYGTTGLDLEEVSSFDHADPRDDTHPTSQQTKVIRLRGTAAEDDAFAMGISIAKVNGHQEQYVEGSHNGVTVHMYSSLGRLKYDQDSGIEWNDDLPLVYNPLPIAWGPVRIGEKEVEAAEENDGRFYYYMYATAYDYVNSNLKAELKVIIELNIGGDDDEAWLEEDNDASSESGLEDFLIPGAIGILLIGGGGAAAALKKKKKKKEVKTDAAVYKMEVYKEFGDTLAPGHEHQPVYARIVKIVAGGEPVVEPTLTAMIEISGDNYLQVSSPQMAGVWKAAYVQAPETDNPPEEGVVTFTMAGDTAGYINHLHFKIEAGRVLFGQDNLTLAAHYDKEVRLPFVVVGMSEEAVVEATIIDASEKPTDYYSVHVEWNAEKDMHEAVIRDLKCDVEKDNGRPGNFIPFELRITATNPGGSKCEGWISLVRYYMGLVFNIGNVKCFYEEHDPQKHKLPVIVGINHEGKTYVPAETTGRLLLYDYDEESHKLLIINPIPTPEKWSVKTVDEAERQSLEAIGLTCDVTSNDSPKGTECILRCLLGGLDAPSRLDAVITMGTTYNGRKYECETQVLLCSQPRRTFQTEGEESAAIKDDKAYLEKLDNLYNHIERQGLADTLLPLLKYIDRWRMGYNYRYGIDRRCMTYIGAMYNHMINDRYDYTYKHREPALPEEGVLWECIMALARGTNELNEKHGTKILAFRIAIGFWTYGATEGAFKLYDYASMVGMTVGLSEVYVDQGADGLTKTLTYMVKDMAKMQIIMLAVNKGLNISLGGLRAKYNPRVSTPIKPADIKPKTKPEVSGDQFAGGKNGRATRQAVKESMQQQEAAKRYINSDEMKAQVKALPDDASRDAAYNYLNDLSQQQLKDLRDFKGVLDVYKRYGAELDPNLLANRRWLCYKVQQNPMTKHMLKHLKGSDWDAVRQIFNEEWYGSKDGKTVGIYQEVDPLVKRILARDARKQGIHLTDKDIKIDAVSGNKMNELLDGKTTAMDRDVHYYYTDNKGNRFTFDQQYTEEIYNSVLYKKATKCKKLSQQQVNDFAERVDNTVIEDIKNHMESLGPDVENLMTGNLNAPLIDPQRVQKTVVWKSADRYNRANEWFEKAKYMTDPHEKLMAQVRAVQNELEGSYMTGKDGHRFIIALDNARYDVNGRRFVTDKLQRAIQICDQVDTATSIDAREIQKQLKASGYNTYGELVQDIDHTMGQILQHDLANAKAQ